MNVTGISAPTAPPVAPAVTRVQAGEQTQAHPQHHPTENQSGKTGHQPGQQTGGAHTRSVPEPPPMKPLSTSEVAVMLGMAPPEVLLERSATSRAKNAFDAYA
jgi:hypothetical protein